MAEADIHFKHASVLTNPSPFGGKFAPNDKMASKIFLCSLFPGDICTSSEFYRPSASSGPNFPSETAPSGEPSHPPWPCLIDWDVACAPGRITPNDSWDPQHRRDSTDLIDMEVDRRPKDHKERKYNPQYSVRNQHQNSTHTSSRIATSTQIPSMRQGGIRRAVVLPRLVRCLGQLARFSTSWMPSSIFPVEAS